jgi:RNA polymerase sigma factor (TIGR02999 family)
MRSRSHFLAVAAKAMRHILINHAVAKKTAKRGGGATRVPLDSAVAVDEGLDQYEILAIHQALESLEAIDPRRAQVVEAKVFGGLTNGEIAEILGVSTTTVESDWRTARAWLSVELDGAKRCTEES